MKIRHMNIIFCSSCGPKIANKWHTMGTNTLLFCNTCIFKCSKHAHFLICYGDKQERVVFDEIGSSGGLTKIFIGVYLYIPVHHALQTVLYKY